MADDPDWTYTQDAYGDWRGASRDGTHRTRLKVSLDYAQRDVAAGRLQVRQGGQWVDTIDGPKNRFTLPLETPSEAPPPGWYPLPARGTPATCASCGKSIVWTQTEGKRAMPLSLADVRIYDGRKHAASHFADCEHARQWSTAKRAGPPPKVQPKTTR